MAYPEEKPGFVVPDKYLVASSGVHQSQSASNSLKHKKSKDDLDLQSTVPASGNSSSINDLEKGNILPDQGHDYILVDWYSETDPENPQNWGNFKKIWIIMAIGSLTLSLYMGSSLYTPAVPIMMEELNTTHVKALLPLTTFILGYGIGPMVLAPISEHVPLGRTYIYIVTLAIFCVLQIPIALSNNIEEVIGLRFLAGFFASPSLSTGGATTGDVISPEKLYVGLMFWAFASFCGPAFGPLIGGIFTQLVNWRWTFWYQCIASGVCLFALFFFLPETSSGTILHRRAKRLRKLTGNNLIKSPYELHTMLNPVSVKEVVIETFWRPIFIAFGEPIVFFLNLHCAFIYIMVNVWFEAFPIVFNDLYGFNLIESGLTYISTIVGCIIGGIIYLYWVRSIVKKVNPEIEQFLAPSMGGAPWLPVGLFIFAWGASSHTHWIAPLIGSVFFCAGSVNIFHANFNYLGRSFHRFLASVFAGGCLMRAWSAAVFPLFVTPMYNNLGTKEFPIGAGGSIIAGVSVILVPIPFVIHRYGVRLRGRSKYAN